tara:strand:- start:11479 stop:11682 length:204 start_codon:yes stop_codon:yes gene_type:complete
LICRSFWINTSFLEKIDFKKELSFSALFLIKSQNNPPLSPEIISVILKWIGKDNEIAYLYKLSGGEK